MFQGKGLHNVTLSPTSPNSELSSLCVSGHYLFSCGGARSILSGRYSHKLIAMSEPQRTPSKGHTRNKSSVKGE